MRGTGEKAGIYRNVIERGKEGREWKTCLAETKGRKEGQG